MTKEGRFPVSSQKVKQALKDFFKKRGIVSDAEVSVALVGEEKMKSLSKKYLKDAFNHSVLSFTNEESGFAYPQNAPLDLGEIVVCYPLALEEAKKESKLVDEKVVELLLHGANHLLGIHH